MERKLMLKKVCCIIGALLIIVLAMVSPFFKVISVSEKGGGINVDLSYNGLDLFFEDSSVLAQGLIWMLGFAFSVIYAIISLLSSDANVKEKRLEVAIALFVISAFLYLCQGIVEIEFVSENLDNDVMVMTMAWFPLVFALLVGISYIISKALINRENVREKSYNRFGYNAIENKEDTNKSEPTVVETLVKYKELMDNGIITEEEYASIKEKILNG